MKKLLLIGDSNIVGEWANNINDIAGNYGVSDFTIDHVLHNHGYAVCNAGVGGSSNINNINLLKQLLGLTETNSGVPRFLYPDYIVWMLTEPLRELYQDKIFKDFKDKNNNYSTLEELNIALLEHSFFLMNEIYEQRNIPVIIIEGLTSTYDLEKKYPFKNIIIKDWFQRNFDYKIPLCCTFQVMEYLTTHATKDLKELNIDSKKIFDLYENHFNHMASNKEMFPDSTHYSKKYLEQLALEIIKKI